MAKKKPSENASIGKFDNLATDTYAKYLLDGLGDDEAEQRGMVAAIMGAQARLGIRKDHHEEFQAQKEAAEKKKKTTITAESFDTQVADTDVERSSAPVAKRRHCLGLFRPHERTEQFKDQLVSSNLSEAFTGLHSDHARKRARARQEVKLAPAEANN